MTVRILRGADDVKRFLGSHDEGDDDPTVWTCPICRNVNYGLYYSHEAPCPKCGNFQHPRLDPRVGYPRVRAMSDRLETLRSDRSDLEDQIEGLRREIREVEIEIREYDYEIGNTEAILYELKKMKSESLNEVRG